MPHPPSAAAAAAAGRGGGPVGAARRQGVGAERCRPEGAGGDGGAGEEAEDRRGTVAGEAGAPDERADLLGRPLAARQPGTKRRGRNGAGSFVESVASALAMAASPSEEREDILTMDYTTISPSSSHVDLKALEELASRQSAAAAGGGAGAALDERAGGSGGGAASVSLFAAASDVVKVNGRGVSRTYHRKSAAANGTTTTGEVVNYVTSLPAKTIAAMAKSVKRQRRQKKHGRAPGSSSSAAAAAAIAGDAVGENSENGTDTDCDLSPQLVRVVEHHHTVRSKKKDFPPRRKFSLWWAAVVVPILLPLPFVIVVVSILFYPVVLSLIGLAYGVTWVLYLKYAQPDLPATVIRMPYLPVNPMRVFQVDMVVLRNAYELTSGLFALAAYNWIKYKIDTGRRRFCRVEQRVFRSVSYDVGPGSGPSVRSWRKVDVYVPVLLKDSSGNVIGVKRSRNVEDRLDEGCPGSPLVGGASPAADVCAGSPLAPVIIYIFGGAWISGSKGMFSPMARTLSDDGYVTVIPNYTLYPQGKIRDMVADVRACITWTHQNIRTYHGDPDKIYIMGHGSGAHLAALTVIQDSVAAAGVLPDSLRWDRDGRDVLAVPASNEPGTVAGNGNGNEAPSQSPSPSPLPVCGLVLFAGVFDLTYQYAYEVKRGIEEISGLARCVGQGPDDLVMASPSVLLARTVSSRRDRQAVWKALPKNWFLIHGDKDNISPSQNSRSLFEVLCKASGGMATGPDSGQGDVRLKMYNNIRHLNPAIGLLAPNTRMCGALLSDIRSLC